MQINNSYLETRLFQMRALYIHSIYKTWVGYDIVSIYSRFSLEKKRKIFVHVRKMLYLCTQISKYINICTFIQYD